MAILAAISEPDFVAQGFNYTLGRKLATPALLAGVPDWRLNYLLNRPDFVLEQRPLLLSAHTSVSAEEWTRLMGANFAQFFTVDEKAPCSGSFNSADAGRRGPLQLEWERHGLGNGRQSTVGWSS